MPPHKWPPVPPPVVKCKTVPLCMKNLSNRRKSYEMVVRLHLDHHAVWTGCSFYEDTRLQSCERRQQHNYLLSCGYHLLTISQIGCIMLCNLHNIIHNTGPRGNITWQPGQQNLWDFLRSWVDPEPFLRTRMLRFSRQKCRILTFRDKNLIF